MKLYTSLSSIGFLRRSYALKFLFISFLGIHVPLIGLVFFISLYERALSPVTIILFTLIMTLVATAVTLYILKKLLQPILFSGKQLEGYTKIRTLPKLPIDYGDEVGQLMRNIQSLVMQTENLYGQKKQLIEILSHDIKEVATVPLAIAEQLKQENKNANLDNYIEQINLSSRKIISFIENITETAIQEDIISKKSLQAQTVDFVEMAHDIEKSLGESINAKNIRFVKHLGSSGQYVVKVDKELLRQVLLDLADNAVKFSNTGGEVKFEIKKHSRSIVISVSDRGKGFSNPEELFKKVKPMSNSGHDVSIPTGLYLSKQIISKFEGNLYAESNGVDNGATFSIELRSYTKRRK